MYHTKIIALAVLWLLLGAASCTMVKEGQQQKTAAYNTSTADETEPDIWFDEPQTVAPYRQTAARIYDLLHTKLDVSFDWEKHHLFGKATLTLKPYFYPSNLLTLQAKGFTIDAVELVGKTGNQPLKYSYNSLDLTINLPKTYSRTDTFTVFIQYTAKPEELVASNPAFTYDNQGLYFIADGENGNVRQIWTQGEPESASCWFPTIDQPNERCTQEISITVPQNFKTLSNGLLLSSTNNQNGTRTDYWKQNLPHAPYLFTMAIDQYAVITDTWRGKEVSYYVDTAFAQSARTIFGNTPEMLEFFSNKLNYPYPWDKYAQAVVLNFVAGAMENTSATLFYEEMYAYAAPEQKGKRDDIIAHELFHHWFGNLVTCESWANLPLNESFATYGEYLWIEHKYGKNEADLHLRADLEAYLSEANYKQEPIIRYRHANPNDMFDGHSYQKGGRVLHMLRNIVGDDAFFEALRYYLHKHQFTSVEIHDLRLAFEHITGQDLNWFFDQWFLQPGHPILSILTQYDAATKKTKVEITQLQTNNVVYQIPTFLNIIKADGSAERISITLTDTVNVFEFVMPAKPKAVLFDPDYVLLYEKQLQTDTQGYLDQFYHGKHIINQIEALEALAYEQQTAGVTQMFADALVSSHPLVRKTALEQLFFDPDTDNTQLKKALINLVKKDPDTEINNIALSKLADALPNDPDVRSLLNEVMNLPDSPLLGTALYFTLSIYPDDALSYAEKHQNTTKPDVATAIAQIFSEYGTALHQPFFEKQLKTATGYDIYTIIDSYGYFLSRIDQAPVVEKGIAHLANIAFTHKHWWVRVIAYQQIAMLKSILDDTQLPDATPTNNALHNSPAEVTRLVELMTNTLQQIKSAETDPNAQEEYNNW